MRLRNVYRIVFRKEFRELLRDRRSLFWLFAPPIILPGLAICAGLFIGTQVIRIANEGFPIYIENSDQAPDLVERFEKEDAINVLDEASADEAVVIVALPEDFKAQLEGNGTAHIDIITKDNSIITFFGRSAVRGVVEGYSDDLLDQRLASQGLNRDWLKPIQIGEATQRTEASVGTSKDGEGNSIFGTIFLPLAVTSWLLGGGMGLILDTTVGEKERQTVENLLVTPASRVGIVMGKMTVVFIASMAVMSMWLTEGLLLSAFSDASPQFSQADTLTTGDAIRILAESGSGVLGLLAALVIMIIPFTVMLNGLVMAWCAYAANYREANLFMALVQLGLPATVLLTIFSMPANVPGAVYAIPLFGTVVAIRDLFSNTLSTSGLTINFISGLIYAAGGIAVAAWMFGREWSLTRGLQ